MYCDTLFVKIKSNFVDGSTISSFLQQIHSLFQSEFLTECDLVLPLPIYSILSFP